VELFEQAANALRSVSDQIIFFWTINADIFDDMALSNVSAAVKSLLSHFSTDLTKFECKLSRKAN
jgi:F0F1-type ATP synthase alpha subunit